MIASFPASRWSLAQRVSLLLFTVLTLIVTSFGVAAYREVQGVTRASAGDRLLGVVRETARSAGRSIAQRIAEMTALSADSLLVNAVRDGTVPAAPLLARIQQSRTRLDSTLVGRALLRSNGEFLWRDGLRTAADSTVAVTALRQARVRDSAFVSGFYAVDSIPHLAVAVPLRRNAAVVGALVSFYRIGRNANSESLISNLLGIRTRVWLVNRSGDVWLDAGQAPGAPPVETALLDSIVNKPAVRTFDRLREPAYIAAADVPGSPYRVVMLQSEAHTMARLHMLGARFGGLALLLILLSSAAVWWISRQMHRDLEAQNLALQEANAAKARFLGVMSHELRTPLNAIAGHAELIALGVHGPVTADQELTLARIQRNKDQLLHLVNDLLFFARLDSQPMPVASEPVRLQEQFDAVVENLRHEFARKGVTLTVHPTETVLIADAVRVQQVLVNLVTNAWRFTETGGAVEVRADTHGARCRIEVRDTGVGIAPEDLPNVFEPFVQVDGSLTRRSGGAGLGLTIVRTLVHAMGGEVAAESVVREGSVFRCWLPCQPPTPPTPEATPLAVAVGWVGPNTPVPSALSGRHRPD